MTRDNIMWGAGLAAAILTYLTAQTGWIPTEHVGLVEDVASLLGVICGTMAGSPLRHSQNAADPSFDLKKLFGR